MLWARIRKMMVQLMHHIKMTILRKRTGLIQLLDLLALVVDEGAVEGAVVELVVEDQKEGSFDPELNLANEVQPLTVTDLGRYWDGKGDHVDEEGVGEVVGALEAGRDLQRWLWLIEKKRAPKR